MNPNMIVFREYHASDFESCLRIFDSNTPKYFAPHERLDFVSHFEEQQTYFVLEQAGVVVACGGLKQIQAGIWVLTYGMVERSLHGQGLGTLLLEAVGVVAWEWGKRIALGHHTTLEGLLCAVWVYRAGLCGRWLWGRA
jgi:GNAT superfamily N-acetyltransferase